MNPTGITGSLLLSGACIVAAGPTLAAAKKDTRPNVIFIMTDQQTAGALSCMGNPWVKTPAMDALAADGVMLTRAYCPYPLSNPCRASLMTGYMPYETGVKDNGEGMKPEYAAKSIGLVMEKAGYECLYAGKWHIPEIEVPDGYGFRNLAGMDDRTLVEKSVPHLHKKYDKPVFYVASFLNPHEICEYTRNESLPYGQIAPFHTEDAPNLPHNYMPSTYEPEALAIEKSWAPRVHDTYTYTQNDWRRYLYAYYRLVERVDLEVGKLVAELKSAGLYDDSVIIFTSDHGEGMAAHQWNQKWALYEEIVNVPLFIKAPKGKGPKGVRNDKALSNIGLDIFVTICDYAGVKLDETYAGKSLRPIAEGKADELHEDIFIETYLSSAQVRGFSIIEGRYKYVLYLYYQNREQLFDLETDPGEMLNLAVDKRYAEKLQSMREKLWPWAERFNEPRMLKGVRPLVKPADY